MESYPIGNPNFRTEVYSSKRKHISLGVLNHIYSKIHIETVEAFYSAVHFKQVSFQLSTEELSVVELPRNAFFRHYNMVLTLKISGTT